MSTTYQQVIPLTPDELREQYQKLSKEELIEMLIANNQVLGITCFAFPECEHNWLPQVGNTTAVSQWQCSKCGMIKDIYSIQPINNRQ